MADSAIIENEKLSRLGQARLGDRIKSEKFTVGRVGADLAMGGVGRAVRREAERRLSGGISRAAGKVAESYKKGREAGGAPQKKRLSGLGFWFIFSAVVIKEILDILLDATLILSVLAWLIGVFIIFTVYFYLAIEGVSFTDRKLTMWIISLLIEMIPFLNILPTFPVMLLALKAMENNEFLKSKMQLASKAI
jgi:hypothetical protein